MENRITVCDTLAGAGYTVRLWGYSALDRYMGLGPLPFSWVETDADSERERRGRGIQSLAKIPPALWLPPR